MIKGNILKAHYINAVRLIGIPLMWVASKFDIVSGFGL